MRGHLCVVMFLHFIQESTKKIHQNRLTHLCVAVVNRLGDSDESPNMPYVHLFKIYLKWFSIPSVLFDSKQKGR